MAASAMAAKAWRLAKASMAEKAAGWRIKQQRNGSGGISGLRSRSGSALVCIVMAQRIWRTAKNKYQWHQNNSS